MSVTFEQLPSKLGMLTIVADTGKKTCRGHAIVRCICDCGKTHESSAKRLMADTVPARSCGCKITSSEFKIWLAMLDRCQNPRHHAYKNYGGRGISVCPRWHEFWNFYADMGRRLPNTSLDRIDNNGNYEPSNCRWATAAQQMRNRTNNKLTPEKVNIIRRLANTSSHAQLAIKFGVNQSTITRVINRKRWA